MLQQVHALDHTTCNRFTQRFLDYMLSDNAHNRFGLLQTANET